jgi:hypothetical protein
MPCGFAQKTGKPGNAQGNNGFFALAEGFPQSFPQDAGTPFRLRTVAQKCSQPRESSRRHG